jgi:guanylate kinase
MPGAGAKPGMSGIVYIISAPSGSGKTTLVNELRQYVRNLEFSISYTTRAPRGSEQDGREYRFISREEFQKIKDAHGFLESAEVFGHYYGTPGNVLESAHRHDSDLLLDIDVQGASKVKTKIPDAVSIFVLPPSRSELESRLRKRSQSENMNSEEVIRRRLDTARKEIENYTNYDYILINDRLQQSADELQAIVLAERIRRSGEPPSAEEKRHLELARKCLKNNMEEKIRSILASFDVSLPAVMEAQR